MSPITGYDGKEISPGIWVIGDINWNEEAKEWRCFVDWQGCLALAAVKVRDAQPQPEKP